MHRYMKLAGVAVVLAAVTACDDFLTGTGMTVDPNFPTGEPNAEQLLIATQVRMFMNQEGQAARTAAIWTQQLAGVNNQQRDYGSRYTYAAFELDTNTAFNNIYTQGGLVDIRRLREAATEEGIPRYEAMGKFIEAFTMGTATSLWGDLPYREAINPEIAAPAIDPQEQIYADVKALLTDAITQFGTIPNAPVLQDLVYAGNTDRWIAAANTLTARYWLHVARRVGQQAYQNALDFALVGINEAPADEFQAIHGQAPGDFRSVHGSTLNVSANTWGNFLAERADIAANRRMLRILEQRDDPRLAGYHSAVAGEYRGSDQFGAGGDAQPWSLLNPARSALDFRQPFITWAENQLIKAEARFMLNQPVLALGHLNDVRTAVGMPAHLGPVTLEEIMVEKWIVQFQNTDAFSDWRRHCYPRLIPGGPSATQVPAARVPGRYVYGSTERQQNPNFAALAPAQQPADNWNFREQGACPAGNVGGEAYPIPAAWLP
jgi:starch-binding outer membrane protein, SusD/RagB family